MNPTDLKTEDKTQLQPLSSTELKTSDVPSQVLIAPWGNVESTRGNFVVDAEAVSETIDAFRQHGTDLPIDFEHQTLGGDYASPDGLAPAGGWVKTLEAIEGVGLMANVEWTDLGLKHLRSRRYRYLSPVAIVRQSDRRMIGIHSAALTNKPAIVGMEAIVNRQSENAEAPLTREVVTCQDASIVEVLGRLRAQLGVEKDRGAREILVATSERIEQLTGEHSTRQALQRIEQAMSAGKLTEAQRDWALQLAHSDANSFDAWFESAPVVVELGRTIPPEEIDIHGRSSKAIAAGARNEYRAHAVLQAFTTEEAFVQLALREAGLDQ